MSLENAKKFIEDFKDNEDENLKKILKNINSKFESEEAKFHYVSEKSKELGYNFTPKELVKAFKNSNTKNKQNNNFSAKFKNAADSTKKFLESLW